MKEKESSKDHKLLFALFQFLYPHSSIQKSLEKKKNKIPMYVFHHQNDDSDSSISDWSTQNSVRVSPPKRKRIINRSSKQRKKVMKLDFVAKHMIYLLMLVVNKSH